MGAGEDDSGSPTRGKPCANDPPLDAGEIRSLRIVTSQPALLASPGSGNHPLLQKWTFGVGHCQRDLRTYRSTPSITWIICSFFWTRRKWFTTSIGDNNIVRLGFSVREMDNCVVRVGFIVKGNDFSVFWKSEHNLDWEDWSSIETYSTYLEPYTTTAARQTPCGVHSFPTTHHTPCYPRWHCQSVSGLVAKGRWRFSYID
jgi:hypothetical protein